MSDNQKKILRYLVNDIKTEIACWDQAIFCFCNNTSNKVLLEKIKVLESKSSEYKKFIENIQTLFEI